MAETTLQRLLRARRNPERRRRPTQANRRPPSWFEREGEDRGDDPEGGAGVREPRRPRPTVPAAALTLDEPRTQHLDLTH